MQLSSFDAYPQLKEIHKLLLLLGNFLAEILIRYF